MASPHKGEFNAAMAGRLPKNLSKAINKHKKAVVEGGEKKATRQWSGAALEVITHLVPETVGGSADLTGSNNTKTAETKPMTPSDWSGRYVHYGVREHGMAAAMNGMSLHGGIIPYSGTFLAFADYSRAAIRLGALMGTRVIHVMTHDSIGLGEDGPTHQPVEQVASLRAMPNMLVFRPADGVETAECWEVAVGHADGPSTMALTRQGLSPARTEHTDENLSALGGYVLSPSKVKSREAAVLIATGSEVEIALQAQAELAKEKSMCASSPCHAWNCSRSRTKSTSKRHLAATCQKSQLKRASALAGIAGLARRAALSAWTVSVQARLTRNCTSISASRPRRLPRR